MLNLKPTNFLLDEHKKVAVGDFGIPYLLLGIPLADEDMALRLGTPNYMAPEQWEPEIRGPLTYETDSWGFGCSIVEMLTGVPVWFGRSNNEIHHVVVINQEKPQLPSGLPPELENILNGCFEYDPRNRPLMKDILQVFERSVLIFFCFDSAVPFWGMKPSLTFIIDFCCLVTPQVFQYHCIVVLTQKIKKEIVGQ